MKKYFLALMCLILGGVTATAQQPEGIKILKFDFADGAIVTRISDNGKWAVAQVGMSEAVKDGQPHIINVDTREETALAIGALANDISDDGNIVVGTYQDCPAWWDKDEDEWQLIPVPAPYTQGSFAAVTPDGHYAVGTFYNFSDYTERAVLFDLNAQAEIALEGLPQRSMTNKAVTQNRFLDISPDGRYILGVVQCSYPSPPELFSYVYDRERRDFNVIGFIPQDEGAWIPLIKDLFFTDDPVMSPNGEWICGKAYLRHDDGYSEFATEYYTAFRYNVLTQDIVVYDNPVEDAGNPAFCIADKGELLGATPMTTPLRNWNVRVGAYWYPFAQIWRQRYNGNFESTGYDQTGTPFAVSGDGRRIVCVVDPQGESYIAVIPENICDAAAGVRLISNYNASPTVGSAFEYISEAQILFDRDVQTLSAASDIKLVDADGKVVRKALYFSPEDANKSCVTIGFRPQRLEAGKAYTIVIPAGSIALAGDATQTNDEIRLDYLGRAAGPVQVKHIYPADNSVVTKVEAGESPILIEFETNVAITKSASARLVRDGGEDDGAMVAPLYLEAQNNLVGAYPASVVYLYDGEHYRIEIDEGSITDIAGEGGNAPITLHLTGNYVREISQTDETLFADDFSNIAGALSTYMLYDGDGNEPSEAMAEMEYKAQRRHGTSVCARVQRAPTSLRAHTRCMPSQDGAMTGWYCQDWRLWTSGVCSNSTLRHTILARQTD